MRRLLLGLALILLAAAPARANCAYFSGPQDVSNIINYLNQLVVCINTALVAGAGSRLKMTTALTLYVNNTNGNDSNDGTNPLFPLLHIQTAINKVCNNYI